MVVARPQGLNGRINAVDACRTSKSGNASSGARTVRVYIPLEKFDQFLSVAEFSRKKVCGIDRGRPLGFHEANDLEELLLHSLDDPNRTPHGPAEIVDIMTLQLSHKKKVGVAGFVLKGRSFPKITPADISHQVFRLRNVSDLKFAILGQSGSLLDEARDEFIHTAKDLKVDYTIIDAVDFARLATIILGVLCPRDAKRGR